MRDEPPPRELTARSLVVGLAIGSLLAAGNLYAGLVLGVVADAALTIVLVSFGVFAAFGRPLAPREANAGQVAGNSAAQMVVTAGVAGPIPALAMSGALPHPVWVGLFAVALGALGTVLAAPLRRSFVVDRALPFPTGRATAELIGKLGGDAGAGGSQVRWLVGMALLAAAVTAARDGAHWIPAGVALPLSIAGVPAEVLTLGVGLSPLLAGVGLLVGVRIGASILGGALLAWCVIGPLLVARGELAPEFGELIGWLLWPGVALMVSSSLASLAFGAPAILRRRAATGERSARGGASRDRLALAGGGACAVALVAIGWLGFGVHPVIALGAILLAALFAVVSMRAIGETDTTPAGPLGGLAQIAIGVVAPGNPTTLFAGGVTNGVAGHAATMMQGFCAGHLLGSRPRALVTAQLLGVAAGAAAAVVAYQLLDRAYVIGSQALPAPSALSWKATADVLTGGLAGMPRGAAVAAGVAALAGIALSWLERRRGGRFVPSPVALGIGFIVGVQSAFAIVAGVAFLALASRRAPGWSEKHVPAIASGLIAGESLCALVVAALILAGVTG